MRTELDDPFRAEIAGHLHDLGFRDGVLAAARLGRQSQGIDYLLRRPALLPLGTRLLRRAPVGRPAHSRRIDREDRAGRDDLDGLRDRILALAADPLAQVAHHILDFLIACAPNSPSTSDA